MKVGLFIFMAILLSSCSYYENKLHETRSKNGLITNKSLVNYDRLNDKTSYSSTKLGVLLGDTVQFNYLTYLGGDIIPLDDYGIILQENYDRFNKYNFVNHGLINCELIAYPTYHQGNFVGLGFRINYDLTVNYKKSLDPTKFYFRVDKIIAFYNGNTYTANYYDESDEYSLLIRLDNSVNSHLYILSNLISSNGDRLEIKNINNMINNGLEIDVEYYVNYIYDNINKHEYHKESSYKARSINCLSNDLYFTL